MLKKDIKVGVEYAVDAYGRGGKYTSPVKAEVLDLNAVIEGRLRYDRKPGIRVRWAQDYGAYVKVGEERVVPSRAILSTWDDHVEQQRLHKEARERAERERREADRRRNVRQDELKLRLEAQGLTVYDGRVTNEIDKIDNWDAHYRAQQAADVTLAKHGKLFDFGYGKSSVDLVEKLLDRIEELEADKQAAAEHFAQEEYQRAKAEEVR